MLLPALSFSCPFFTSSSSSYFHPSSHHLTLSPQAHSTLSHLWISLSLAATYSSDGEARQRRPKGCSESTHSCDRTAAERRRAAKTGRRLRGDAQRLPDGGSEASRSGDSSDAQWLSLRRQQSRPLLLTLVRVTVAPLRQCIDVATDRVIGGVPLCCLDTYTEKLIKRSWIHQSLPVQSQCNTHTDSNMCDAISVRHDSEPLLVVPAEPTPKQIKQLSDIDDQEGLRMHLPLIMFYKSSPSIREADPAKVIVRGISWALVHYYPLAGRLIQGPNRKLSVDCTGEGVLFVEAEVDIALDQLGDSIRPPSPHMKQFPHRVPGSDAILGCPLLLFQVTS